MGRHRRYFHHYGTLLIPNIVIQFGLYQFSSLSLDRGEMLCSFLYASFVFWLAAVMVILRRPRCPTRNDVFFLHYGLLIISLACWIILPMAWRWRDIW